MFQRFFFFRIYLVSLVLNLDLPRCLLVYMLDVVNYNLHISSHWPAIVNIDEVLSQCHVFI